MEKPKLFVLDTSVICHDPDCLHSFEENDILIPPTVIKELNGLKKGNNTASRNAREAIRIIAAMPGKEIFNGGSSLGEGLGKLRILKKNFPFNSAVRDAFDGITNDALIVNTVYCLANPNQSKKGRIQAKEKRRVIFVSKDSILRLQAESLDLEVEDYKNDSVPNSNSLSKEAKKITIPDSVMEELYSKKEVHFTLKEELFENECIILNSDNNSASKTALAFYANGKINLIPSKDKMVPFNIKARNSEQAFSLAFLLNPKLTLVALTGKAGTGKTILALAAGLQYLEERQVDELYFTRVPIPVGHDTGFLPGDINDKLSPYMQGMHDNLAVIKHSASPKQKELIEDYKKKESLFIAPIGFIRGRSLVRKYFIIDEAQNLTPHEIKTLITRAGEGTIIVLLGDISQIDSPYLDASSNGLSYLISRFQGQDIFAHVFLVKGERSYLASLAGDLL